VSCFIIVSDVKPLLDDRGNIVYYLGVQYDVTNQIQAQQEIESSDATA
jgi:hypothetical protein